MLRPVKPDAGRSIGFDLAVAEADAKVVEPSIPGISPAGLLSSNDPVQYQRPSPEAGLSQLLSFG